MGRRTNVGAADRLDFTAIGPAVNLVSRLAGCAGRSALISGTVAAETASPLLLLGEHMLRGIAAPRAVFTLPDAQANPAPAVRSGSSGPAAMRYHRKNCPSRSAAGSRDIFPASAFRGRIGAKRIGESG